MTYWFQFSNIINWILTAVGDWDWSWYKASGEVDVFVAVGAVGLEAPNNEVVESAIVRVKATKMWLFWYAVENRDK